MVLELTKYTLNIDDTNIKILSKEDSNIELNMILFTDYDYKLLDIGIALGNLEKTILKAEYCIDNNDNEYYNVTVSITMRDYYIYVDVEGRNMNNPEIERENILNIEDTLVSIKN